MKKIIIQRHGRYDSSWPEGGIGNATPEEQATLGRLTPKGVEGVKIKTLLRLSTEVDMVPATNFLIVYSPTYWLDDPTLGQRAYETAKIIAEEIRDANGNVIDVRLDFRLGEALMFQTSFAEFLRKKCVGQGADFWKAFSTDQYREERLRFGAEGPEHIAKRMSLVITEIYEMLKRAEDDTIAWVITHGECVYNFGKEMGMENVSEGYNDGFELSL